MPTAVAAIPGGRHACMLSMLLLLRFSEGGMRACSRCCPRDRNGSLSHLMTMKMCLNFSQRKLGRQGCSRHSLDRQQGSSRQPTRADPSQENKHNTKHMTIRASNPGTEALGTCRAGGNQADCSIHLVSINDRGFGRFRITGCLRAAGLGAGAKCIF